MNKSIEDLKDKLLIEVISNLRIPTRRKISINLKNHKILNEVLKFTNYYKESNQLFVNLINLDFCQIFEIMNKTSVLSPDLIALFPKIIGFIINLPYCFGIKAAKFFSRLIIKFNNLSFIILKFGYFYIDNIGIKALSEIIRESKNITTLRLYLNSNKITDSAIKLLSETLFKFKNLSHLFIKLDNNKIEDIGAKSLFLSLSHLTSLTYLELDLSYNNISDDGIVYFCETLSRYNNLTSFKFNFDYNKFAENTATLLSTSIFNFIKMIQY